MTDGVGGRGDQCVNDAAAGGLDKAAKELGVARKEASASNGEAEAAREERLQQLIDAGYTNIVAVGFAYAPSVTKVAKANPKVKFALVDSTDAKGDNIENITFAEHEGSFLVGAAAALKSKTGNIGFVGGVEIDLIKKFEAGFTAGAKAVNPNIKVQTKYLTQPPDFSGFGSVDKGKTAAEGMYQNGADVIYHAAGAVSYTHLDVYKRQRSSTRAAWRESTRSTGCTASPPSMSARSGSGWVRSRPQPMPSRSPCTEAGDTPPART